MNFHYGIQVGTHVKLDEAVLLRIGRDKLRDLALAKLPGNEEFVIKHALRNWDMIVDSLGLSDVHDLISNSPLYLNGDEEHDLLINSLASRDNGMYVMSRYPMRINLSIQRKLVRENLVGPEIALIGAKNSVVKDEAYGRIRPYCSRLVHLAKESMKKSI